MSVYNIDGSRIDEGSGGVALNYDANVLSVNHRGYSTEAPENTLPAYKLSKEKGFNYAETDVSFTSDGVAVLLHDSTIDRTSNGSGAISEMTFSEARQYDFGSWKNTKYKGTKIPSLDEFLYLCKSIMIHPYIELKSNGNYTESQIQSIVDAVKNHGMKGKVTYISFSSTYLEYVKNYDGEARLGFLASNASTSHITTCQALKTSNNQVFYDVNYGGITQSICNAFSSAGIPIEAWTVNSENAIIGLNKYVSGITSDNLIAGKVLYNRGMR